MLLNMLFNIFNAFSPEILIIPIPPSPAAVEIAAMVSSNCMLIPVPPLTYTHTSPYIEIFSPLVTGGGRKVKKYYHLIIPIN
jgi:hypothetical protein